MCNIFHLGREEKCGQTKKRKTWCVATSNQEKKYTVCSSFQLAREEECGQAKKRT